MFSHLQVLADPQHETLIKEIMCKLPCHDESKELRSVLILPPGVPPEKPIFSFSDGVDGCYLWYTENGSWVGTICINDLYLQHQTPEEQKERLISIITHEYGHHYTLYWRYHQKITKATTNADALKIFEKIEKEPLPSDYWQARGITQQEVEQHIQKQLATISDETRRKADQEWLLGNKDVPELENAEILAEDYVFLLCSLLESHENMATYQYFPPPKPALHGWFRNLPEKTDPSLKTKKQSRLRPDRLYKQLDFVLADVKIELLDLDCTGGFGAIFSPDAGSTSLSNHHIGMILQINDPSLGDGDSQLHLYIHRIESSQIGGVLLQKNSDVHRPCSTLYQAYGGGGPPIQP